MKNLYILLAALLMTACNTSDATLSGRLIGTRDRVVHIEYNGPRGEEFADSTRLGEDGSFSLNIKAMAPEPELYTLRCGSEELPLLIKEGDQIEINAIGNIIRNYTLNGSEESELLRQFYQHYTAGLAELESCGREVAQADEKSRNEALKRYTECFRSIKRDQLRFIVEHKESPAAVYALYQRMPGESHLFNAESDMVYYRAVCESLGESYPESRYIAVLEQEVERLEARQALLGEVREAAYPDLEMNDMYGRKQRLSDLTGQVILLDFWSATAGNSNQLNAELKELYAEYHDRGFEIYQVGVDRSKSLWISAIQEQLLPWISVSDLQGENSIACRLYQVQRIPANYLFDREGNIVGRDLYGEALEKAIQRAL